MSVGQRIKTLRKRQGLSIDELASRLGKNRTTIYRYENGDIENLPLGILDSLANALDTTPACLMGWNDVNTTDNADRNAVMKMKHVQMWCEEFGGRVLTEEEGDKLIEYANFLFSLREK